MPTTLAVYFLHLLLLLSNQGKRIKLNQIGKNETN